VTGRTRDVRRKGAHRRVVSRSEKLAILTARAAVIGVLINIIGVLISSGQLAVSIEGLQGGSAPAPLASPTDSSGLTVTAATLTATWIPGTRHVQYTCEGTSEGKTVQYQVTVSDGVAWC
jgi:hypothetical protein